MANLSKRQGRHFVVSTTTCLHMTNSFQRPCYKRGDFSQTISSGGGPTNQKVALMVLRLPLNKWVTRETQGNPPPSAPRQRGGTKKPSNTRGPTAHSLNAPNIASRETLHSPRWGWHGSLAIGHPPGPWAAGPGCNACSAWFLGRDIPEL